MYSLTNEQKKKIKKELGIMVNDINELLKKSGVKEISININHSKEDRSIISDDDEWVIRFFNGSWRISIEHNKMRLFSDSKSIFCKPDWWLFAKKRNGRFVVERSIEDYCYPIGYSLLLNYETNRKRIIEALDNEVKNGKTVDEELEGISSTLSKLSKDEVEVEFMLPETIGQRALEVTKEDGKTIGVIDFGGKLVKVVTSGDIVLVQREKGKEKIK